MAPSIVTPPVSQSVTVGDTVVFSVTASGTDPLTYQWAKDGSAIPGATEEWFALTEVQIADAGGYTVAVTNSAGQATSPAATLQVNAAPVPPTITSYPVDQSVVVGSSASFSVVATGSAPLHYQWRQDSTLVGSDSATFDATTLAATVGTYPLTVTVTNTAGSVTSNVATLTVHPVVPPPVLLTPPSDIHVQRGGSAVFSVVADGGAPLHYHWKLGTTPVGTDSPSYDATSLAEQVGSYPVTVTVVNSAGSVTSNVATLTVTLETPVIAVAPHLTSGKTDCEASTVDQGSPAVYYLWTLHNATITAGQGTPNLTFTPGAPGVMSLEVTAMHLGEEATGRATSAVEVAPAPDLFCQSEVFHGGTHLLASTPVQSGMTYLWSCSGNLTLTSPPDSPVVTFDAGGATGTGQLTVAVQNAAGDVTLQTQDVQLVAGRFLKHDRAPGSGRNFVTATLLKNGRVLVVGGNLELTGYDMSLESLNPVTLAELFDPGTQTWKDAASMSVRRIFHTATRLANGKVLVTGGYNGELGGIVASAELYDPATDRWSSAGSMMMPRYKHAATLLRDGKVLVVGSGVAAAELYDPETNTWSSAASMMEARGTPSAALLTNGWVLVAGGAAATAELYDPEANTWTRTRDMSTTRYDPVCTLLGNGRVLVTGGTDAAEPECYDLDTNTWQSTGSILSVRDAPGLTLLQNGKVLVSGGLDRWSGDRLLTSELYDPATNAWSAGGSMTAWHPYHTTVALENGKVLVAGAGGGSVGARSAVTELYDMVTDTWSIAGSLSAARVGHTTTLLGNGKVLMAGGMSDTVSAAREAMCYDPATRSWSSAGTLPTLRVNSTATLLANGKVLLAGGFEAGSPLASALCYDPLTNTWASAGSMANARVQAVATRLLDGRVLVVGGAGGGSLLTSAECYDPSTDTWSSAGNMATARLLHTLTLLPNGKVLVTGGTGMMPGTPPFASVELYDPATNTWSTVASLSTPRRYHTATCLADGRVMVLGGTDGTLFLRTVEFYDPALNTWTPGASLTVARDSHSATLLPDGKVLVAGGRGDAGILASGELYDPILNSWPAAGTMVEGRYSHTAVLMGDSTVLLVGGRGSNAFLSTVEFWKP